MLEKVWKERLGILRAMVRHILFDHSSIDDVLQDAFARLLKSRKTFRSEEEAYHYSRKVVFNTAIDHYRQLTRHSTFVRSSPSFRREPPTPLALLIREEEEEFQNSLLIEMRKALRALPLEQKQAIDLIFSRNGKKLKDICQENEIPYSTLRSRMMAGVDQIRRQLRGRGFLEPTEKGDQR